MPVSRLKMHCQRLNHTLIWTSSVSITSCENCGGLNYFLDKLGDVSYIELYKLVPTVHKSTRLPPLLMMMGKIREEAISQR